MKSIIIIFLALITLHNAIGQETFSGPYASWANVKQRFGAKGDGRSDDTESFQRAINGLANFQSDANTGKNAYTVIYLPAGTYIISKTLLLHGRIGISIIGEDPEKTTIKWKGSANDTILSANGSAYFKLSRICWDAGQVKGMQAIGIHWKTRIETGPNRTYASLNIEISDNIFQNGFAVGISGGTYANGDGTGWNDSEVTIRRCKFYNCSFAGIHIKGYNALDYWIWDCEFISCNKGIHCAHGNYHVYNSYFRNSTVADVFNFGPYYTSVRNSFSDGSAALSKDTGESCNPFKRIFENNIVVASRETPIQYSHLGKISLLSNHIEGFQSGKQLKEVVSYGSWCPGGYQVLSIGNQFPVQNGINIHPKTRKIFTDSDVVGKSTRRSAQQFRTGMDKTPAKKSKHIYEVTSQNSATDIQNIISKALKKSGTEAVIHFAPGRYTLDRTIEIPEQSTLELIGDGLVFATIFVPAQSLESSIFVVHESSKVAFRDMQIGIDGSRALVSEGIKVFSNNQRDAELLMDQIYTSSDSSLVTQNVSAMFVQKTNSFFSQGNYFLSQQGTSSSSQQLNALFVGGQFANLKVSNYSNVVAKDCWWEGSIRTPINLEGSGNVTIDGAMISPANSDSLATIKIGKFDGRITLQNMYMYGSIDVERDNPKLSLLAWNIHMHHKKAPLSFANGKTSYKSALLGVTAQCNYPNDPFCAEINTIDDRWINQSENSKFLNDMTKQGRTANPRYERRTIKSVSSIYLTRVAFGVMPVAIRVVNR